MDFFSATTFGFMAPKGFTKNPESLETRLDGREEKPLLAARA